MKMFIKRVSDGEVRQTDWEIGPSRYWWEEGNGSCDCNRAIAFGDIQDDPPCGETAYELVNEDGTPFTNWPEDTETT